MFSRSLADKVFSNVLAEQAVILVRDYLIAFTADPFEALAVNDIYRTSCILDIAPILQMPGGDGYALTADAEHICNEIVRHNELIRRQLVMVYKEPTAKLLLDAVEPVADCSLRDLRHKCLCVSQKKVLKNATAFEFGSESVGPHANCTPRALDDGAVRGRIASHK